MEHDGLKVRVMAGTHQGTTGPIIMRNPGLLMDVTVSKGATFSQEVQTGMLSPLVVMFHNTELANECAA